MKYHKLGECIACGESGLGFDFYIYKLAIFGKTSEKVFLCLDCHKKMRDLTRAMENQILLNYGAEYEKTWQKFINESKPQNSDTITRKKSYHRRCPKCNKLKKLTKHHRLRQAVFGPGLVVWICRTCHDEIEKRIDKTEEKILFNFKPCYLELWRQFNSKGYVDFGTLVTICNNRIEQIGIIPMITIPLKRKQIRKKIAN